MKKKLLSLLLVATMVLAALPIFAIGAFASDEALDAEKATNAYEELYVQDGLLTLVTTYDLLASSAIDALTDNNGNAIKLLATDEAKAANASAVNGGLLLGANTTFALDGVIPLTEDQADYTYQFVFELADIEPANKTIATESQFSWEGAYAARPAFTAGPINILVEPISKDAAKNILETSTSAYISDYQFEGGVAKSYIQMYDYWHSDYDRTNKMPRLMAFDYENIATLTLAGNTTKTVKTYEGKGEDGSDLVVTTFGGSINTLMRDNTAVSVNAERFIQNQDYTTLSESIKIGNDFPMVLYSVRAYNRELSAVEINQNHFADIANKLSLNTLYFSFLSDYGKQMVYSTFANFALDALSASDAQDLLDSTIENVPSSYRYSYDDMIVSDGLVANLSFDAVSESDLCDVTEFKQGSTTIAEFLRYSDSAPEKCTWAYGNGFLKTGLNGALDMSSVIADLDSFTVQTVMAHNSADDASLFTSADRSAIDAEKTTKARVSVIHAGLLRLQYRFNQRNSGNELGGITESSLKAWDASKKLYSTDVLSFDKDGDPALIANALNAPFDFSISQITDAETGAVTATVYNKATQAGDTVTLTAPAAGEPLPVKSLVFGAGVNASIYAVRVYDRALTAAEYAQNHFADLARQFRISLALFNRMSDAQKAAVYEAYANVALTDASLSKEAIESTISKIYMQSDLATMASLLLSFKGFQMATTDNVAIRPLYALDNNFLAFAESNAKVTLGVLSAPASTANITVTANAGGITPASGVTFTEIYKSGAATNGFIYNGKSVCRFADPIAPTDYNAEYAFRAVVVLEMGGNYAVAYCDTASDLFGASVSAKELAAYFYAEGYTEGGVKTVYDATH